MAELKFNIVGDLTKLNKQMQDYFKKGFDAKVTGTANNGKGTNTLKIETKPNKEEEEQTGLLGGIVGKLAPLAIIATAISQMKPVLDLVEAGIGILTYYSFKLFKLIDKFTISPLEALGLTKDMFDFSIGNITSEELLEKIADTNIFGELALALRKSIEENAPLWWKDVKDKISNAFSEFKEFITDDPLTKLKDGFSNAMDKFKDFVETINNNILIFISSVIDKVVKTINNILEKFGVGGIKNPFASAAETANKTEKAKAAEASNQASNINNPISIISPSNLNNNQSLINPFEPNLNSSVGVSNLNNTTKTIINNFNGVTSDEMLNILRKELVVDIYGSGSRF